MYEKTVENLPVDVAIFTAAVADFRVKEIKKDKIKENFKNLEIEKTKIFLTILQNTISLDPSL